MPENRFKVMHSSSIILFCVIEMGSHTATAIGVAHKPDGLAENHRWGGAAGWGRLGGYLLPAGVYFDRRIVRPLPAWLAPAVPKPPW